MEFATMMELLLSGLAFTLQIFVTTLIGSLPLGVLVAFGRMSGSSRSRSLRASTSR